MPVAAIYDIHGNLPALEAVLEDARRAAVDRIVVGGDVFPGPMPRESLACLLDLDIPVQFIQGNGDREVLARMRGQETNSVPVEVRELIRWSAEQLPPEYEPLLASWPKTLRLTIPGLGDVLFCHATPDSDTEIFTRLTHKDRLTRIFQETAIPVVVCGHTHMQFDLAVGDVHVVNAGSVGMPFEGQGAFWLLLGPDVQFRCTSYDLASAGERVRGTMYPKAQEFAERNVLQPPSERETLEAFARVDGR